MVCNVCKQKEAIVHYAEIVEGVIQKLDLCEQCALDKGIGNQLSFSMSDMISGITEKNENEKAGIVCSQCSMKIEEFRKSGKLGCDKCYETFSDTILPMLEQIHRSNKHKGKIPSTHPEVQYKQDNISSLEKELRDAIAAEDFEKAAYLRDEIKKAKKTI